MKRPRLPRIQLRRPKLGRPVRRSRLRRPFREEKPEAESTAAAPEPPRKRRGGDLWFRVSTRFRAVGYWLREKGQEGERLVTAAGGWVADLWLRRSREGRIRIVAVAGVLVLYAFLKLAPITAIPCQISAVRECAPPDDAVALVPADALLYAHLTLDEDSTQFERADDAFERLSELRTILAAELPGAVPTPSGAKLDVEEDILPWAERELALALLPGGGDASNPVVIAGVGDRERADQFLAKIAPAGAEPRSETQGDASLSVYPDGFAAAYVDQGLVFGDEPAVRAVLDAGAGAIPSLDGEANAPREQLPDARFAEVYLSREGVQRLLAGRAGAAAQLDTFVDYGATSGFAAAAVGEDDGVEIELVSDLDPALAEKSPSVFASLPAFEPSLADEAGARAIGLVGVGALGPTLSDLLGGGGKGEGSVAASLRSLASRLEKEVGVNPLQDLLPELGGQAALVAEPTDGIPFVSLVVEDVNEEEAAAALAVLQKPLLASLARERRGQVPQVQESDEDGVTVRSLQLSPTMNLSYAVFDGKLVISTDPAGIAQVRADAESLAGSEIYDGATDRLPDRVSALVFLNLDELFGQVTRTDLVEDPFFANLSVLFENASSLGLAVNGESDRIRSQLFLALD